MSSFLDAGSRGAAWGLIATLPMSAVMLVGQRLGWMKEQPPEALTKEGLRLADVLEESTEETVDALAAVSHFAFGAASGAVFGLLRGGPPNIPPMPMGMAFGVAVWAASYRGWIPAMGLLPPEQHRGRRGTTVMIAAHVVFGATLGVLAGRDHGD